MKKVLKYSIIISVILLSGIPKVFGQSYPIQITTIKKPPHLFRFDDIDDLSDQIFVSIANTSSNAVKFNLNFFVEGPKGLTISANTVLDEVIALESGEVLSITGNELEQYGLKSFSQDIVQPAKERDYLLLGRLLREGRYSLCITATDPLNPKKFLSDFNEGCDFFDIVYGEPPFIVLPENKEKIIGSDFTILNVAWTHSSFGAPKAYDYTLKIVDITPYSKYDPIELMERPGIPVIYEEVIEGGLFIGLTDLDLENEHHYAIRVTAADPDQLMEFESGGKSNVVAFQYIEKEISDDDVVVPIDPTPNTSISDNCDCTISLVAPQLVVTKANAERNPRKLKIDKLDDYGEYLLECNPNFDESTHDVSYTVNWTNTISNSSEDYNFPASENLPTQFCIDFNIRLRSGTGDAGCNQTICIDVPEDIFDVIPADVTTGEVTRGDTILAGKDGEFEIIASSLTRSGDLFTGTGDVFIAWLQARVQVEFRDITVDAQKRLLSGSITAVIFDGIPTRYPTAWGAEAAARNTWSNNIAGDVVDWIEGQVGRKLPYQSPSELTTPITMPLGVIFSEDNQFAITEMEFTRNRSKFNMIAAKTTPANWGTPQTIGFKAEDVKFHRDDIEFPSRRFELVADLSSTINELTFTLKAPTPTSPGCYIEWNESGFSRFGLELESTISRNWLIPTADEDGVSQTHIRLLTEGSDWDELLFTGNLEKSEIVGSGGIKISAENITYDMSDVLNPPNIVFPSADYVEQTELFKGFFAKSIRLELPETWETGNDEPLEIVAENMIIDNLGVSMNVTSSNVAAFNAASVLGFAASIDDININIISNEFRHANIDGKLILPISDVASESSRVNYSATLNIADDASSNTNFSFLISPTPNQEVDFSMINSTINLGSSSFTGYIDSDSTTFHLDMNGRINIVDLEVGPLSMNSLGMDVEGLGLTYNSSKTDAFDFNIGTWRFNSPQKYLKSNSGTSGGFGFSVHGIGFEKLTAKNNEYFRGKINFNVDLNLIGNTACGSTKIGVTTAIDKGSGFAKFKPTYISTKLEEVSVNVDLGAVILDGKIAIRDADPILGDGFLGDFEVRFKVPETMVESTVEFGTINNYRYWRVQAGIEFPTPILFAGGFGFKGFGGGAYYNMKATENSNPDPNLFGKDNFLFVPKKGTIGMNLKAVIVAPKEESFNSDVVISGEFTKSDGIKFIDFKSDLWMGASIPNRDKALIRGNANVHYDFVDKIFFLNASIELDRSPLYSRSGLKVKIEPSGTDPDGSDWYVKFGDPIEPNTMSIGIGSLKIPVQSYLMFGNNIPIPQSFTKRFSEGYEAALGHAPSIEPDQSATSEGSNSRRGAGIAMGSGFNFSAEGYVPVVGSYYAGVKGTAGAEFNLSLLEYPFLKSKGLGLNGWQAGGSIGFYASLEAGAYKKRSEDNYTKKFSVASFAGGGYVVGRFPNPTWARGEVAGKIKVGCVWGYCLINCGASVGFKYGENVDPGPPNVAVVDAVVDHNTVELRDHVVERMEKEIVQYIRPNMTNDFKINEPIRVRYNGNIEPNKVIEITTDDNGLRLFKFDTKIYLKEENPMTCNKVDLTLSSSINADGEYLYTAETAQDYSPVTTYGSNATERTGNVSAIGNTRVNRYNFYESSNSAGSTVNKLAPETYYLFAISFELKELIDGTWQRVKFNDEYISEVTTFGFWTESSGLPTAEKLACDNLYHEMTLDEWRRLTPEQKTQLRDQNGGVYYISSDGDCRCPRVDADTQQEQEDMADAMAAAAHKIGQSKNHMSPSQLLDLMNGMNVGQGDGLFGQGNLTNPPREMSGVSYRGMSDFNAVNTNASGSFGGFNMRGTGRANMGGMNGRRGF